MKTPYEKKSELGINNLLFGFPKKKVRILYVSILVLIIILGFIFG
jgi:hypothetical protein